MADRTSPNEGGRAEARRKGCGYGPDTADGGRAEGWAVQRTRDPPPSAGKCAFDGERSEIGDDTFLSFVRLVFVFLSTCGSCVISPPTRTQSLGLGGLAHVAASSRLTAKGAGASPSALSTRGVS